MDDIPHYSDVLKLILKDMKDKTHEMLTVGDNSNSEEEKSSTGRGRC